MATLKKIPGGKWEVRSDCVDPVTGRRRQQRRAFSSKGEASDFKARVEAGVENPARAKPPKFEPWIKSWFAAYQVTAALEATTICSYQCAIDRLIGAFGALRLDQITPSLIEGLYARMMRPHAPQEGEKPARALSPATCIRHHATLRKALQFAVRDGLIKSNPCDLVQKPKTLPVEIEPPTDDTINDLLDRLAGKTAYLPILIAAMTGMRESEVMGLQWQDVDFDAKQIHVRRVRVRPRQNMVAEMALPPGSQFETYGKITYVVHERTKNHKTRAVHVDDGLLDALRDARKQCLVDRMAYGETYTATNYVCVTAMGVPISYHVMHDAMPDGVRVHDLRHANATLLIDGGVPIPEVARRLGHSTPTTTTKTYAHAISSQNERASQIAASRIGSRRERKPDTSTTHRDTTGTAGTGRKQG